MNDYWVKPTVEQLRAELEWERQQQLIRRKRRSLVTAVAAAIAVFVIGGACLFPRLAPPAFATETVQQEQESKAVPAETEDVEPEAPQPENAVVFGK